MNASSDSASGPAVQLPRMAVLLCATLACGVAPMWAAKRSGRRFTDPVLDVGSCFWGGVLLSSCLLDQVPVSLLTMRESFLSVEIKLQFPLPEFLLSMGFFLVLLTEQIILVYEDQSRTAKEERRALLMELSVQSQRGRSHDPGAVPEPRGGPHGNPAPTQTDTGSRLAALRSIALALSLSLHAVLEGVEPGAGPGADGGRSYASLLLRRCLLSPSLGVTLARSRLRPLAVAGGVLLFSLAPLLGVALSPPLSAPRPPLARSTLDAVATGAFVYAACLEAPPCRLIAPLERLLGLALLLAGFSVFTAALFLKT